ncbi:DUF2617 family protein [Actinomadura atramentaria]|uniref:DUF2617 family protein n=1 Tax=Actinomadura atramentaria TaxID=1990 RepID=UPI00036AC2EB|nr:DUF2617 family protein [Actinomadura atramentaria]
MLAPLAAPYADTRADALRFALGLPPLPALAALTVRLPAGPSAGRLAAAAPGRDPLVRPPAGLAADLRAGRDAPASAHSSAHSSGGPSVDAPGGWSVEFRLLGASHQVVVGGLSETVACLAGAGAPLPARHDAVEGPLAYAFRARTERHADDAAFARAVAAVRAAHDGRPDALTGAFPGDPHAVTVLAPDPPDAAGIGWRTWHAYPQTREIVMTASRLAVAE